jgi:outer membrane protein
MAMAGALAWAQPADDAAQTVQLTLPEALARVLQIHPDMASAQAAITRAAAEAKIQRARRWPLIMLEAGVSESKTRSAAGVNQRFQHDAAATLDFTLYQSGLAEQIARVETLARAQKLGLPDAQRLLTFEVKSTYYQILALQQVLRALMQSVAASVRHQEVVEARIEAGTAPRSDLLPILVEVSDARLQAIRGETDLKVAEAGLRSLLQLPAGTAMDLAPADAAVAPPGDLQELVARARTNRPDVRQQELSVRAAALGTQVARIDAGPVLSATATGDVGEHTDVAGDQWLLAVRASYPLFDAGASRAAVTSARASEEIERQRLESLVLQVQQDVETAHVQVVQAVAAVENAAVARRDAENSLAAAEARYVEGLAIIIEVTDAQVALLRAQVNEIQARFDAATALAALDQAVGVL